MPDLIYEKKDGIAYLTMNRPEKRNAMSPQMIVQMARAWEDVRDDPEVRVAILTGSGSLAFTAGADLALSIPLMTGARKPQDPWEEQLMADRGLLSKVLLRNFDLYKPVIAAVNGPALAGGTEVLQGTDIRLSVPNATFGLSEVQRGIIPSGGSLVRLARQIPYCKAMEILLVGDPISAAEAHRIGLINEVVPTEHLLSRAETIARRIAANAPLAVARAKQAVVETSGVAMEDAYRIENRFGKEVLASQDAKEGPRAFMEKRKPNYVGH